MYVVFKQSIFFYWEGRHIMYYFPDKTKILLFCPKRRGGFLFSNTFCFCHITVLCLLLYSFLRKSPERDSDTSIFAKLLCNTEKLVILCISVRTAGRSCFYLACTCGNCQICNKRNPLSLLDLWEITARYPFSCASRTVSIASVRVPI